MAMTARCFAIRVPRPVPAFHAPSRVVAGNHGARRAVLQLPRIRRKNMPVSLTAALQFLPTRAGPRFPAPTPDPTLGGAAIVARPNLPSLAYGLQDVRAHRLRVPHAPPSAQAATTRRRALARGGRGRTRGRTRSSRSAIASGAAQTMTLRWYAPCSFNDAPPPGGASKFREEP